MCARMPIQVAKQNENLVVTLPLTLQKGASVHGCVWIEHRFHKGQKSLVRRKAPVEIECENETKEKISFV